MAKSIFSNDDLDLKFGWKAILAVVALLAIGLFISLSSISNVSYAPALSSSTAAINSNIQPYPGDTGPPSNQAEPPRHAPIQEFVWIVYPLFFIAGYFVTVIARKFVKLSGNDFALALSLAGTLLLFISLLLLLNLSTIIQNIENDPFSRLGLYAWVYQLVIFGILGIVLSYFGNQLNKNRTPLIVVLSFVVVPTIFLESAFLLGLGVRDYFTYSMPNWYNVPLTTIERFGWIGTFALFAILTFVGFNYLRQLKDRNALNALARSLKIAGWIFCGIGLTLFIFSVMQINFADSKIEQIIGKIAEPTAYAIIGGIILILFERMKK